MNLYRLTKQETEILTRLSRGGTVYGIARDMAIRQETVRRHCNNAMAKLEVRTRAQALYVCGKEGLV